MFIAGFPTDNLQFKTTSGLADHGVHAISVEQLDMFLHFFLANPWFIRLDVNGVSYSHEEKEGSESQSKDFCHPFLLNSPCWDSFVCLYEPREPEVELNNCPIKLWLGGNSASQQPAPLLPSLILALVSSLTHTHTSSHHTQTQIKQMCSTAKPGGHDPWMIAGMISSQRAHEEMVKLSGRGAIKEADACTHPSWLFIDSSLQDPCPAIVSWCDTGAMLHGKAYCTFLINSQWRSRKQANITQIRCQGSS